MPRKNALVLHHTDDPSPKPQFAKVYAYHDAGAGKKWPPGHGIQYPKFIEKDGRLVETGDESRVTWHAGNAYYNECGIAVCLAGDFTREAPTPAQLDSLVKVATDLQNRWGIPDNRIFLHREVRDGGTQCPGTDLRSLLLARRAELLAESLTKWEKALRWATGLRKSVLTRLVERVRRQAS